MFTNYLFQRMYSNIVVDFRSGLVDCLIFPELLIYKNWYQFPLFHLAKVFHNVFFSNNIFKFWETSGDYRDWLSKVFKYFKLPRFCQVEYRL